MAEREAGLCAQQAGGGRCWRSSGLGPAQTTHLKRSRSTFSKQLNNSGYTSHAVQETQVPSLGWEDPLEKGMATHSSTLAWESTATVHGGGRKRSDTAESTKHARGQTSRTTSRALNLKIKHRDAGKEPRSDTAMNTSRPPWCCRRQRPGV